MTSQQSHPNRLQFLKSYSSTENLISMLKVELQKASPNSPVAQNYSSDFVSLLKSYSTSNRSNIMHFILQNPKMIQEQQQVPKLLQFLHFIFSIDSHLIYWLLRFRNQLKLSPVEKFIKLHNCEQLLSFSVESDLKHLQRLYKDMKDLELFTEQHQNELSSASEQSVKLLEVKNQFIKEKNHVLQKIQNISSEDQLQKLKVLNFLFQYAFRIRIVARRDSSCCFRVLNNKLPGQSIPTAEDDSNSEEQLINDLYTTYDELLNIRYTNRMLNLLGKPLKDSTQTIEDRYTVLLEKVEALLQKDKQTFERITDSWHKLGEKYSSTNYSNALKCVFDCEHIHSEDYVKEPQLLINFLAEKKFLKQVTTPRIGDIVTYSDHASTAHYVARIVEAPTNSEITVLSQWTQNTAEGPLPIAHSLHETPSLLYQNISFYRGDLSQIRYYFRRQVEKKYNLSGGSSRGDAAMPKGMTKEDEKKLNSTMEEVQKLLLEAKGSLSKMKE